MYLKILFSRIRFNYTSAVSIFTVPELNDYLDAVLERNPHTATFLGVHEYNCTLPSSTLTFVEDGIGEAQTLNKRKPR